MINQLDIADGLKELLISNGFTLRLVLKTSTSDLAKILGIDDYVAKLVSDAAKKIVKISAAWKVEIGVRIFLVIERGLKG